MASRSDAKTARRKKEEALRLNAKRAFREIRSRTRRRPPPPPRPAGDMGRGDSTARGYLTLAKGSSTFGLDDCDVETRDATLSLRRDWKFYALVSFCHTFRAVMRLPEFTSDQLERGLLDPTGEVVVIELLLRLIETGPRGAKLAVNDWEKRLKHAVHQIAQESDYFEDGYPDPEVDSGDDEEAVPGEETGIPGTENGIPGDTRDPKTVPGDNDEDDAEDEDFRTEEDDEDNENENENDEERDKPRGHPLRGAASFFTLTPTTRLDILNALCEERVESDESLVDEVEAMAAAHAASSGDAFEGHPEAHGLCAGADSDNRSYFSIDADIRVWRWEKPAGAPFGRKDASGQKDPGFCTVCVSLPECRALAKSLESSIRAKDKALFLWITETHMPYHEKQEEKSLKALRVAQTRQEDLDRRNERKEAYDQMDRKRSGRIALKIAEDAERRRVAEEADESLAEAEAIATGRDLKVHDLRVRWMLLPARLRSADTPEGMDGSTSDAAMDGGASDAATQAKRAALKSETKSVETELNGENLLSGPESIGRYLRLLWDDDGAWYDAVVEGFDSHKNEHTVRYLADSTKETLDLGNERMTWVARSEYVTPSGSLIPVPEREPVGLQFRGVRSGATTLFVWRPKQTVAVEEVTAAATSAPVPSAGDTHGDGETERKQHACRKCLENGVVSADHGKFGKKCPFHPEFVAETPTPLDAMDAMDAAGTPDNAMDTGTAHEPRWVSDTLQPFQTAAVGVPRETLERA